ncbi:MAG: hypothetical protein HZC28_03185 [Spirochaetes bacterium]|nr:hypothetical protein [Spirochaetota bacterium]
MADLDETTKAALVRKGNDFYNQGKMIDAHRCYLTAGYKSGIEKIGDHYFYEERQPLIALRYYFIVKSERTNKKVDEIFERMIFAFRKMLRSDDESTDKTGEPR